MSNIELIFKHIGELKMANETLDKNTIIERSKSYSEKWIKAFNDTKNGLVPHNQATALACLKDRDYEGKPVRAYIVSNPKKIVDICKQEIALDRASDPNAYGADKSPDQIIKDLNIPSCVYDFYMIAFWDSCYSQIEDKHPFLKKSLFPAFEAGMWYLVNLGEVIIGVMAPKVWTDANNRLHRQDGPAIVWDDIKSYWWHGVRVPDASIEAPETLTLKEIMDANQETRRSIIEIIGWDLILTKGNAKSLQRDDYGELVEMDGLNDGDAKARFVRVVDSSTSRKYALRVPPETKTAREAVAWTFGEKEEDYAPSQEA